MDASRKIAGYTAALTAALILSGATRPRAAPTASLDLRAAWARPAAMGATDAGYLRIDNPTDRADALVGARSAVAAAISIHESRMVGQVMTMRTLKALAIPARTSLILAPGGRHLMMTGLKRALRAGDRFAMTLTFAKAGGRNVEFGVGAAGPPAPSNSPMRM